MASMVPGLNRAVLYCQLMFSVPLLSTTFKVRSNFALTPAVSTPDSDKPSSRTVLGTALCMENMICTSGGWAEERTGLSVSTSTSKGKD
ncbi:hypothetical protein D3C85_543500 [compost metagenome]